MKTREHIQLFRCQLSHYIRRIYLDRTSQYRKMKPARLPAPSPLPCAPHPLRTHVVLTETAIRRRRRANCRLVITRIFSLEDYFLYQHCKIIFPLGNSRRLSGLISNNNCGDFPKPVNMANSIPGCISIEVLRMITWSGPGWWGNTPTLELGALRPGQQTSNLNHTTSAYFLLDSPASTWLNDRHISLITTDTQIALPVVNNSLSVVIENVHNTKSS